MAISRRNFLFGTVAATAAGTAIVLRASNDAIKLFQPTLHDIVAVSKLPQKQTRFEPIDLGSTLYAENGTPVCIVTGITIHAPVDSLVSYDMNVRYVSRPLQEVLLEVEPIDPHDIQTAQRLIRGIMNG